MFPIRQEYVEGDGHKIPARSVSIYGILCLFILPLLLFSSDQSSLMAHDEGLYAWRGKMMIDAGDWIHPWSTPHHKTPGFYWLMAMMYTIGGINETSVRFPSLVLGFLSMVLVYEIGRIILNQSLAFWATIILSLEFLWLQYCRLGTPDVPMVFLSLLAIYLLLKAEFIPQERHFLIFGAGFALGLGFLVRSLMMVLPIIALLPYLLSSKKRQYFLAHPYIYLGFVSGLIPTFIWLYLTFQDYGIASLQELFGFAIRLGSNERGGNGILFYLWNVPLKSFPWGLFAILGGVICVRTSVSNYKSILLGFPLVLLIQLSLVSTRLSHYSLLLYPFIAFLAAIGLDKLSHIWFTHKGKSPMTVITYISYGLGGLGIICFLAGIILMVMGIPEIRPYATIAIAFGFAASIVPIVYKIGVCSEDKFTLSRIWLASLLIPFWLGLAATGLNGFFNDYNPQIKQLVTQPPVVQILKRHPIHFVNIEGKTAVLLNFYTPRHGQRSHDITDLPHNSYAWVKQTAIADAIPPHRIIGQSQEYCLIQVNRPVMIGKDLL
ncbi:ArnT family glycosyltransferase [Calothrix sp. NIES-3974]|uniref:ArnT family glycosyltransferase n=1 Tax=Calothrix sp. NIES-3974 TaxID=2005462 RepID=UPI000B606D8D|nr:glycosyltransferase family 39 protein [Calothrix sp. NIES-3974]BAZ07332.1 hypothetical protein NIES3974_39950 [Calothrix sp. NIES-3974]